MHFLRPSSHKFLTITFEEENLEKKKEEKNVFKILTKIIKQLDIYVRGHGF